eukprot:gene30387-35394_t
MADFKKSRKIGYAATLKSAPAYSFSRTKETIPGGPSNSASTPASHPSKQHPVALTIGIQASPASHIDATAVETPQCCTPRKSHGWYSCMDTRHSCMQSKGTLATPSEDTGPGPGAYGPSIDFSRKGAGIGTSTRGGGSTRVSDSPSPLDYSPSARAALKSAPAYSFGGKADRGSKDKTPGPGAYNSDPKAIKPSMPSVSIALRPPESRDSERKPGPNEYSLPPQQFDGSRTTTTMKFRHDTSGMRDPGPGPGQYQPKKESREGRSFGVSRSQNFSDNGVPGPGSHDPNFDVSKPERTAWGIGSGSREEHKDDVPGPGTYLHGQVIPHDAGHGELSGNRSTPAYTFAGKTPKARLADAPAPHDYGLPFEPMRKSAPAFTFRTKSKADHLRNKNPGPGAYDEERGYNAVRHSMPSINIANRFDASTIPKGPGPNEYSLPSQDWDSNTGGVTIKSRHVPKPANTENPAPHDYADKDIRSIYSVGNMKKGYTFGVRHKKHVQEKTPGPQYRVGCTTLGIAAAEPMYQDDMDRVAVL